MEVKILRTDQDRAEHFKHFLELLVEKFQPTRIISFGKQTQLNELEGCFVSKQIKYQHYCLLICTESSTRIDYEVQEFASKYYHNGQVTIVCHGEIAIRESIESGNRFFITVLSQGKHLYTKEGFLNMETIPDFNPSKALERAERNYFHRFYLASEFLECAKGSIDRDKFAIGTFLLHQAVEQSCSVLIRVLIDYRSEFHNLHRLLGLCRCFSEEPYKLLVGEDREDRRLFDILIKSYSQARYASEFEVEQKDAKKLLNKISRFVDLVKTMCASKLEVMTEEATNYKLQSENY
jgi:uncharacterized protein